MKYIYAFYPGGLVLAAAFLRELVPLIWVRLCLFGASSSQCCGLSVVCDYAIFWSYVLPF